MSVEAIAVALHHSRAKGVAKLVLIGIANHLGDGGAWPSVATLARYANVEPRNVQRALTDLEQLHEIRRHIQRGGMPWTANHRRPNRYEFLLACPPGCDRSVNHAMKAAHVPLEIDLAEVAEDSGNGVTEASPHGVTETSWGDGGVTGGVTEASPEPYLNRTTDKDLEIAYVSTREEDERINQILAGMRQEASEARERFRSNAGRHSVSYGLRS